MCVQESVLDNVVARLKNRMEGMKCVALTSEQHRAAVEAAVREAEQQGAEVSYKKCVKNKTMRKGRKHFVYLQTFYLST